jgi:flagellar hook-associated protein 3 FlgL
MKNLNKSFDTLNRLNSISTTGELYTKASDNPAATIKAFSVRRDLSKINLYKSSIVDVKNILTDVEATISSLNDLTIDIGTCIEQAKNNTYSETERKAIAEVLKNYQVQILNNANKKSAGRYIFGGTNIKDLPFTVSDGKLYYNGVDVDTGTFKDEHIYVDLGMGMTSSTSTQVNDNTAFDIAYPGIDLLGHGVDSDGISNNLYNIVGDLIEMFENNDVSGLDQYAAKFEQKRSDILVQYADIGEKTNFVDFLDTRLRIDEENAYVKQDSLEYADIAEALMNVAYQRFAYEAALKVGSDILQSSLLDYLR